MKPKRGIKIGFKLESLGNEAAMVEIARSYLEKYQLNYLVYNYLKDVSAENHRAQIFYLDEKKTLLNKENNRKAKLATTIAELLVMLTKRVTVTHKETNYWSSTVNKNILSFVKALYFWPLFVVATAFWYSLILIINSLQFFKLVHDPYAKYSHYCAYMWAKSIIQLMPGWKVHMIGRENIPKDDRPCVVVANHESIADIWAMYHLGIQFKWMSKIENFGLP